MVVILWVLNGKDNLISPKQLRALSTDVRHWEEPIDFIAQNGSLEEIFIPPSLFKRTLKQHELY